MDRREGEEDFRGREKEVRKDCMYVGRKGGGNTCGRKLQAEEGLWETRVNISEIKRCWTLVSCGVAIRKSLSAKECWRITDKLRVEFGEAGLAGIVEY